MAFSESVKLAAKRRSHYTCVWCQGTNQFIEVHHIVAQEEGGPDTIENAAPLCAGCHSMIGANRDLRNQLTERRDWWWSFCQQRQQSAADAPSAQRLDDLLSSLRHIEEQGGRNEAALTEIKGQVLGKLQAQVTAVSAASSSTEIFRATEPVEPGVYQLTATVTFTGSGRRDGMPDPYHSYFVVSTSGIVSNIAGSGEAGAVVSIVPVSGDSAGSEQHLFAPRGTPADGMSLARQVLRSLPQNRDLKEEFYARSERAV